ncbi:MAG: hypothetical protein Q4P84_00015 [Elusimicrobiales bacterium]|nr:hypothetical protein [Elusimicrobiales bacterium]
MQTQQQPQVIGQTFCSKGHKNTIPENATGTNRASLEEGFPTVTELPINEGGIPAERGDFNGLGNLLSQFYFAFQNGWWPTFIQEVSDAIGGYPQGAVLWIFDADNHVYSPLVSLVANNTYNFNTNPEYIGQYWDRLNIPNILVNNISATSGSVTLEADKVYQVSVMGNMSFALPAAADIDTSVHHQIKLFLNYVSGSITWGTEYGFFADTPDIGPGVHEVYFDFVPNLSGGQWVVGALSTGAMS